MWVWGACLFCAGAWGLQQQAALPGLGWLFAFGTALLMRWVLADRLTGLRRVADGLLLLAAGVLWAAVMAHARLAARLPTQWEGRDIQVEGVVAELPQSYGKDVRFIFAVERVHTPLAPSLSRVQVTWYSAPLKVKAGERWRFTVRLKRPHGTANPFGSDRAFWCLERDIQALGYVHAKGTFQLVEPLVWRFGYVLERTRHHLRERILRDAGPGDGAGVLAALAIGDQAAIPNTQWQTFTRTGVGHLMSISGLHITMLSGLGAFLAGLLWRCSARLTRWLPARKVALVLGLGVGAGYAALSGFGVPAQRTVWMLTAMVAAVLGSRQWSAATVLAAALWAVTILDPFAVLASGFWLSFGAVALILYISQGRLGQPGTVIQWGRTQMALTLGLIPLLLLLFQQISLVSPLANAFAIPLVGLVVVPLVLLGMLWPTDFLLVLANGCLSWCLRALEWLDGGDAVVWQQAVPPLWALCAAAVGAVWLLAPRGWPGRGMGALAFLPLFLVVPPGPAPDHYWIDVLDVGQGLAAVVRTARHTLLFDTGPSYSAETDAGDRIVLPHLRASGIPRLDGLVVSHDDNDHSGGAASVLAALPVGWMASSLPSGHALKAQASVAIRCRQGQRWEWDGVAFEFLHPSLEFLDAAGIRDNDRSCVLRVRGAGGSVLIPGDIEAGTEAMLTRQRRNALKADVLVAPHHGSATSSTLPFLRAVAPRTVIITSGYRNRHGHPRPEVLERYRQLHVRVYRSDRDGAVLVRTEATGLRVQAWRDVHRRYWYD